MDHVGAFIAGDRIGAAVAGAVDGAGAGHQRQVFDMDAERIADRGIDQVGAFAGVLDD